MRLLGVDVDQVLVDPPWGNWLCERATQEERDNYNSACLNYHMGGEWVDYDLSKYFPSLEDPYNFWRNLDYTGLPVITGAQEKLEELSQYFGIVFISTIKGNHNKTKYYWLKKNFPYMKGYLATKEKDLMNDSLVAMIDDRVKNLEGFDPHKRILYNTQYRQEPEYRDVYIPYSIENWQSFNTEHFCRRYL